LKSDEHKDKDYWLTIIKTWKKYGLVDLLSKIVIQPPALSRKEILVLGKMFLHRKYDYLLNIYNEGELRKNYGDVIILTDRCCNPGLNPVEPFELLPGELSAVTFTVGCYTVRSAERVYKLSESRFNPEAIPADQGEVEIVKAVLSENLPAERRTHAWSTYYGKLALFNEICAKHSTASDGKYADGFKLICRADIGGGAREEGRIECIGTIKENESVSDNSASLVVKYSHHSDGAWYKLDSENAITKSAIQ
jgi:hypothetical protein